LYILITLLLLLNSRSEQEREVSFIPSSISETEFYKRIEESAKDEGETKGGDLESTIPKDTMIVSYCTIGFRSGLMCKRLVELGYENVRNSEGVVLFAHEMSKRTNGDEVKSGFVTTNQEGWL